MAEIDAYDIRLEGKFGIRLVVNKIKVFTTKEEANQKAQEIADKSNLLKFSPTN